MTPSIFISAGEASGEHYGALLITALRAQLEAQGQAASFFGMGGQRMESAGLERITRAEEMAVMGFTEVVRHLPLIYREFRKLKKAIRERKPAVAVLIDYPGFHFKLAEFLHSQGVPVVFFVSPQLWAWKKGRIKLVRKYIDRMLVIFPFEEPFYRERGVDAEFVGHPLAEQPLPTITRDEFARENGLDPAKTWIGLLPGSRAKEIRELLPEMLRAARELARLATANKLGKTALSAAFKKENLASSHQKDDSDLEFVLPLATTLHAEQRAMVRALVEEHGAGLSIRLLDEARATLFYARASIVASGTATVEAALLGNPFVVVYRVSPITYAIAKRLVKVPHVAMANLIAGKRMAPELIQEAFTAENIVQQLGPLLPEGRPRQSMMEELRQLRGWLHAGRGGEQSSAIDRVASVALELASPAWMKMNGN